MKPGVFTHGNPFGKSRLLATPAGGGSRGQEDGIRIIGAGLCGQVKAAVFPERKEGAVPSKLLHLYIKADGNAAALPDTAVGQLQIPAPGAAGKR